MAEPLFKDYGGVEPFCGKIATIRIIVAERDLL